MSETLRSVKWWLGGDPSPTSPRRGASERGGARFPGRVSAPPGGVSIRFLVTPVSRVFRLLRCFFPLAAEPSVGAVFQFPSPIKARAYPISQGSEVLAGLGSPQRPFFVPRSVSSSAGAEGKEGRGGALSGGLVLIKVVSGSCAICFGRLFIIGGPGPFLATVF